MIEVAARQRFPEIAATIPQKRSPSQSLRSPKRKDGCATNPFPTTVPRTPSHPIHANCSRPKIQEKTAVTATQRNHYYFALPSDLLPGKLFDMKAASERGSRADDENRHILVSAPVMPRAMKRQIFSRGSNSETPRCQQATMSTVPPKSDRAAMPWKTGTSSVRNFMKVIEKHKPIAADKARHT